MYTILQVLFHTKFYWRKEFWFWFTQSVTGRSGHCATGSVSGSHTMLQEEGVGYYATGPVSGSHTMLQEEEDERQAMNQSYSTLVSSTLKKKSRLMGSKDIQTHVFVWGLNDKDQLGGPKGSKVGIILCRLLCVCVCVRACMHVCVCVGGVGGGGGGE